MLVLWWFAAASVSIFGAVYVEARKKRHPYDIDTPALIVAEFCGLMAPVVQVALAGEDMDRSPIFGALGVGILTCLVMGARTHFFLRRLGSARQQSLFGAARGGDLPDLLVVGKGNVAWTNPERHFGWTYCVFWSLVQMGLAMVPILAGWPLAVAVASLATTGYLLKRYERSGVRLDRTGVSRRLFPSGRVESDPTLPPETEIYAREIGWAVAR